MPRPVSPRFISRSGSRKPRMNKTARQFPESELPQEDHFPLQPHAGILEDLPLHLLDQAADLRGGRAAPVDDKPAVLLRDLRVPDAVPAKAGVHDQLPREVSLRPLEGAAGARIFEGLLLPALRRGPGAGSGVALYCPVIVKYRDEKTAGSVTLEDLLR